MNHICTWLCADEKGEESLFPQTGQLSSSASHQNIYWRCLLLFFATSRRFHKQEKHLLFTNVKVLPVVDGRPVKRLLEELDVEVIVTDFKYKTPKGYFGSFQNQFYEFSILEYIASSQAQPDDLFLVLDSDCIFTRSAEGLFNAAREQGFLSFEDDVLPDYVINGLSRNDLKDLYEEFLGRELSDIPGYHYGELLLCSAKNIRSIHMGFVELWPKLMTKFRAGLKKFNEEAHTLSFLYYQSGFSASTDRSMMKRIWTNPLFYRNVEPTDINVAIWHLPAEKTFGLYQLYDLFFNQYDNYGLQISNTKYSGLIRDVLGVPHLTIKRRLEYYTRSYYRAIRKRIISRKLLK